MIMLIGLCTEQCSGVCHWRGTVRPGMIAHAWQDSLSGVLGGVLNIRICSAPGRFSRLSDDVSPWRACGSRGTRT